MWKATWRSRPSRVIFPLLGCFLVCSGPGERPDSPEAGGEPQKAPGSAAGRVLRAIEEYARRSVRYDASYTPLLFPGGEPPPGRGACTDLVVVGLRAAGIDLQLEVQEDIRRAPGEYRRALAHYGSGAPDPSIDHRRVANLEIYFRRHLTALPVGGAAAGRPEAGEGDWLSGDIVVWDQNRDGWPDHVGVVAAERGASGRPLVYHNYPRRGHHPGVAHAGDCLVEWKQVGRYRVQERK